MYGIRKFPFCRNVGGGGGTQIVMFKSVFITIISFLVVGPLFEKIVRVLPGERECS